MILSKKFSSICICAGSLSNDIRAARIMKSIKKLSPETTFFGVGGPMMVQEGLKTENNYGDPSKFLDKPFFPLKNHLREHVERPWHPVMAQLHYRNEKMIQNLLKNRFFPDLLLHKPQAFVTVGNEMFARDLYCALNQFYEQHDSIKPPTFLLERFSHNQRSEFKTYLDHFLYTVPTEPVNWRYFTFPSTNVGQEGVFKAYQFLYQGNNFYKQYANENSIYLSPNNHQEIIENLIHQQRSLFRKKHFLSEDQSVIYLAPGNTTAETSKFLKLFKESIETFLKKNGHNKDNFCVVISLQNNEKLPDMPIKVVLAQNEQEKFEGMAGSDYAVAVNGDIVNECAAFQLPTIILNDVGFFQAYFTLLYNQFSKIYIQDSDVNFTANGMVYPELMASKFGDAFPQKLADWFEEFQNVPKTRFIMAKRLNPILQKMVPKQPNNSNEIVAEGNIMFKHMSPDMLAAQRILESVKVFSGVKKDIKRHEIEDLRENMIKQIIWN